MRLLIAASVLAAAVGAGPSVRQDAAVPPFDQWLAALRTEAAGRGIRPEVIEKAFADVQPVDQVLERDRTQAEFTLDLDAYLKRRLKPSLVRTAQTMYAEHRDAAEEGRQAVRRRSPRARRRSGASSRTSAGSPACVRPFRRS